MKDSEWIGWARFLSIGITSAQEAVYQNSSWKDWEEYDLLSLTLNGLIRDMENPEGKFPSDFSTYQVVKPDS